MHKYVLVLHKLPLSYVIMLVGVIGRLTMLIQLSQNKNSLTLVHIARMLLTPKPRKGGRACSMNGANQAKRHSPIVVPLLYRRRYLQHSNYFKRVTRAIKGVLF